MTHAVFTNNARTTLSGSLTNVATSASVVDGSVFPAPTGGDYAYLTIEEGVLVEIVKLTARSTNTLTITRAQDGTTAQAFTTAATVSLRLPRIVLDEFQAAIDSKLNSSAVSAFGGTLIDDANASTARTTLGLGTAAVVNTGTSGATIPLLNATNSWSAAQSIDYGGSLPLQLGRAASAGGLGFRATNSAGYMELFATPTGVSTGAWALTGQSMTIGGSTVWHAGNDGAGSGLDADTLDGYHVGTSGATIPLLNGANTFSAAQIFSSAVTINAASEALLISSATNPYIRIRDTTNTTDLFLQATDTVVNVGSASNHDVWLYSNNIQRGRITAAGDFELANANTSSDAKVRTRKNGNNIEWGHTNTAGYQAALGAEVGTGAIFITLNAEAGTDNNTYRTRGLLGSGIRSNNAGGMQFFTLTNSNADNQSPTYRMSILAGNNPGVEINGRLNLTTSIGTTRSTIDWGYTQSGLTIRNNDNTPLYLGTTGTNRVAISATGDMFYTATPPGPSSTVSIGFRGAPRNRQDSSYTLVLADAGFSIIGYGSTASQTWTIPANGSVAYPIGTTITFCNMRTVACSIACTTDTMYLAGVGTTGTRTLASYGWATAVKVDTTNWLIGGTGLT